jgi:hypothetical protein
MVSASMMTGCANVTLLILPPVLLYVYLASVVLSLIGLSKGRDWTHEHWTHLVVGFYNRGIQE